MVQFYTLKKLLCRFRPKSESKARSLLTFSPSYPIKSENEGNKEKYIRQAVLRPSITANRKSFEVLNFQHGKKTARKISSDYVQTIDYIEHKTNTSLRSIEYSKMRPSLSVSEYQIKNKIYQEAQKGIVILISLLSSAKRSGVGIGCNNL